MRSQCARTLMLPNGFPPPQVHEHEKCWPACSRPSRCQRRSSIDLQPSHVGRAARPFGPSVTRTAPAKVSIPRNIFSRASVEKANSLAVILILPKTILGFDEYRSRMTTPIFDRPVALQKIIQGRVILMKTLLG
jgi:hypothetical protein